MAGRLASGVAGGWLCRYLRNGSLQEWQGGQDMERVVAGGKAGFDWADTWRIPAGIAGR